MATTLSKTLYIIVPCYNERLTLEKTNVLFLSIIKKLISAKKISKSSKILFVNDGSTDETFDYIKTLNTKNNHFCGISLSKNCGHQNALMAGLKYASDKCDMAVTIDCDGQDDINKIEDMVDAFTSGFDIVYGVRNDRSTDSWFKRFSAETYYKLLKIFKVDTVFNHADYRLMSKRAIDALLSYEESNLYLRGMVPLIGFSSTKVFYERKERIEGETHYPLSKMVALAINGITSFSVTPLRIIMALGVVVAFISFVGIIWSIVRSLTGNTVTGWASMTCIICFVSGIQMLSIGVIGEYIGKIYMETKKRPKYFIDKIVD